MTARHWLGLALVIGWCALFVRYRRRVPMVAFGLLWAAVALAPVSNLLTPTGIVMAERVLFLPTIGFAIAAAGGLMQLQPNPVRRVVVTVMAAWGVMLVVRSATRVPTWSSEDRFYSDIAVDGAQAYHGWMVAAKYWDDAHDQVRAAANLQHAIDIWPHDYEVFERLGQLERQHGHCERAIPLFTAGLHEDSSATSLRAKLIECLIVAGDFDAAQRTADLGVALGETEFQSTQLRVAKLRQRSATGRSP